MSENRDDKTDQPSQTRLSHKHVKHPGAQYPKNFGETGNRVPAFVVKHVSR